MESDPKSALGHLNRGIAAFEDGDLETARRHFAQTLHDEPENELAWLWLAEASETPGQKRYCLDRAVAVNPDSSANFRRDALRTAGVESQVPPVINDLAKPPLPPSLRGASNAKSSSLRNKLPSRPAKTTAIGHWNSRLWLALAAIALLLLAGAWAMLFRTDSTHRGEVYLAVVGPMSGESAAIGQEMKNSATIARDKINSTSADGPKIELLFFDDRNDPELAAKYAQQIVADNRIVGVIGHATSSTSLAAAPIYAEADLPAISGQATIDELSDYPNYFRTIFSNNDEAVILTQYLQRDLSQSRVSIVAGSSDYEQSLAEDFQNVFSIDGTVANIWTIGDDPVTSVAEIVTKMQAADDMGALFLAVTEDNGYEMLLQLRTAGLDPVIVGSEALGTQVFARRFATQAQDQTERGFFTRNLYAVSPLLYDSVGGETLAFAQTYRNAFGKTPTWRAPKVWDGVTALATAARMSGATGDTTTTADIRRAMVNRLRGMNSPETGFQSLSGPVFFSASGQSPQGLSMGMFEGGNLQSAPVQYRLIDNPTNYDIEAELATGNVLDMGGYYMRRYRVVYVGIEMIELRDLSSSGQSYKADFYIYFRYNGDDAPLNILFTNAEDSGLSLGEPLTSEVTDSGMNYRLYRVQGSFTEPMDFSNYPWDQHELTIRLQNPELTQNDVVYVADPAVIGLSQQERLRSGFDLSRSFNRVPSWEIASVQYQQVSIPSTANEYDTDGIVYYSEFRVTMTASRDVNAFLSKNLLPLALLTLVTYIAIWFPAEQAGARIGFAITALLSSSVMLNSISSQLPEIGYIVAIEWGYYAYIGLSAILVLLTIAVDRSYKAKRYARVRRLDTFLRIVYPLAIAAVIALYWLVFHDERWTGGLNTIQLGVMLIMGILLALSAVMVFWPNHFDWRSLRGYNDPDLTSMLEAEPAGES